MTLGQENTGSALATAAVSLAAVLIAVVWRRMIQRQPRERTMTDSAGI